ncbi:hypothetical protein [uncultured Sphingomonas sp.]|uniref:hypothetical protein n=1 Tax=uncultured Sphingomonas sp. TaxID=158754 RepID=UPI0035C9696D
MIKSVCAAALATAAVSTAAMAAGPLQVVSKVMAEQRVRAADGSTSVILGPAKKVVPGDRVIFVLAYRNTGRQPISGLVLDNPVPRGIAYRGPAANSPAPDVSVDGKTYGALAALRVRTVAGALRAASPDDVTNVRWRLAGPLAAGAQGQLAFQAVLK